MTLHTPLSELGHFGPVARLTYTGAEIVAMAETLNHRAYGHGFTDGSALTSAEFIMAMARMVGEPVLVPLTFERNGAELPFIWIDPRDADVGDLLIFAEWDAARPWSAGILISDGGVDDNRAQFIGIGHCLPVNTRWMKGAYRKTLVGAYRFANRRPDWSDALTESDLGRSFEWGASA